MIETYTRKTADLAAKIATFCPKDAGTPDEVEVLLGEVTLEAWEAQVAREIEEVRVQSEIETEEVGATADPDRCQEEAVRN